MSLIFDSPFIPKIIKATQVDFQWDSYDCYTQLGERSNETDDLVLKLFTELELLIQPDVLNGLSVIYKIYIQLMIKDRLNMLMRFGPVKWPMIQKQNLVLPRHL